MNKNFNYQNVMPEAKVMDERMLRRIDQINAVLLMYGIEALIFVRPSRVIKNDFCLDYLTLQLLVAERLEMHFPGMGCEWVRAHPFTFPNLGNIREEPITALQLMLAARHAKKLHSSGSPQSEKLTQLNY